MYAHLLSLVHAAATPQERNAARTQLADSYPLDASLWLQWLTEVAASPTTSNTEWEELVARAVHDYVVAVDVWVYVLDHDMAQWRMQKSIATEQQVRRRFEDAVATCGSHYTQAHKIWDKWIAFETEAAAAAGDSSASQQIMQNVAKRRALSPTLHVQAAQRDYMTWFPTHITEKDKMALAAALETATALEMDEKAIRDARGEDQPEIPGSAITASNSLLEETWLAYVRRRIASAPNKTHALIFERAVADCCLSQSLWNMYVSRMEDMESASIVHDVSQRAIRNVPESAVAWSVLVRAQSDDGNKAIATARLAWQTLQDTSAYDAMLAGCASTTRTLSHEMAMSFIDETIAMFESVGEFGIDGVVGILLYKTSVLLVMAASSPFDHAAWSSAWDRIHYLCPRNSRLWLRHVFQLDLVPQPQRMTTYEWKRKVFERAIHCLHGDAKEMNEVIRVWYEFELVVGTASDWLRAKKFIVDKGGLMDVLPEYGNVMRQEGRSNTKKRKVVSIQENPGTRKRERIQDNGGDDEKKSKRMDKKSARRLEEHDVVLPPPPLQPTTKKSHAAKRRAKQKDTISPTTDRDDITTLYMSELVHEVTKDDVVRFLTPALVNDVMIADVRIKWKRANKHTSAAAPTTSAFAYVDVQSANALARELAVTKALELSGHKLKGMKTKVQISHQPMNDTTTPQQIPTNDDTNTMDVVKPAAARKVTGFVPRVVVKTVDDCKT